MLPRDLEITCKDGTTFVMQRETVRGEGTFYSIWRHAPNQPPIPDGVYDGSYSKTVLERRLKRRAKEWERW